MTAVAFRALYPEFAAVPDGDVEQALQSARAHHDVIPEAVAAAAAHLLAVAVEDTGAADNGAGVVTVENIGNRDVTYAMPSGRIYWWRTAYGRRFVELTRTAAGSFPRC